MNIEQLVKLLSEQYSAYGYCSYSMSKFEEYELYLRNKEFLISDRVLTFTDTDGKLMALKPDVTLSIIKNAQQRPEGVQKVYYRENVYRPGKNDQGFREIMQLGLECIGAVDNYCILEVLLLAVKSLQIISPSCILDISHMGLVSSILDDAGLSGSARTEALKAISNKNTHELTKICGEVGVDGEKLIALTKLSGKADLVLPQLEKYFGSTAELTQLKQLVTALKKSDIDCVNVDFSVINDMNYYNGIVFRGFIEGVPECVLSGGQYNTLMAKMKRKDQAIGFALYPDLLERVLPQQTNSVDAVLYYAEGADISSVAAAMADFQRQGIRVLAQPGMGKVEGCKCYCLIENEVKAIENDA